MLRGTVVLPVIPWNVPLGDHFMLGYVHKHKKRISHLWRYHCVIYNKPLRAGSLQKGEATVIGKCGSTGSAELRVSMFCNLHILWPEGCRLLQPQHQGRCPQWADGLSWLLPSQQSSETHTEPAGLHTWPKVAPMSSCSKIYPFYLGSSSDI